VKGYGLINKTHGVKVAFAKVYLLCIYRILLQYLNFHCQVTEIFFFNADTLDSYIVFSFVYRIRFRVRARRSGLPADQPSPGYSEMSGLTIYAATMFPSSFACASYADPPQRN
jgi:hypothetical protein